MSTTSGLPIPTQTGMLGKNPNDSVVQGINANTETLMGLRKVSGGKRSKKTKRSKKSKSIKRRKGRKFRGGGDGITVPIVPTPYRSTNGVGQDLQSQQTAMAKNLVTSTANAEFDKNASKGGGKRFKKSKKSRKSRKTKKKNKKRKSKKIEYF
jgi:hypothetical protein